jgi:hypothetical protein
MPLKLRKIISYDIFFKIMKGTRMNINTDLGLSLFHPER